ncbi:hypothetical protein EON63_15100 [archaeon]|nr:MAG: hypothetical protein EON63_15100 [archaeon]
MHSGDATLVLPAQKLYVQTVRTVKYIAQCICTALNISGPFNIQLLARDNMVKVRHIRRYIHAQVHTRICTKIHTHSIIQTMSIPILIPIHIHM